MNHRRPIAIFATLVLAAGLAAQDYEVSMRPASDVVLATAKAELILTIDVKNRCKVPASLVSGLSLSSVIDGKKGPKVSEAASGKVTLAAGTKLERRISLALDRVAPNLSKDKVTRLTFAWNGLKGVAASMDVAPDLKKVDVEKLDLAKTKVLLVTNYGEMLLKFHPDKAPNHVKNFIKLSKNGFYNGTRFHRVIRGFMIQGGCPNTKKGATGRPGTGGPGYSIKAEFNDTRHVKGTLSMARSSDPNSAGCQFFIVHATAPHLDNQYTAFGELEKGEDTLDKIAGVEVDGSTPKKPVHLKFAIVQPVFKKN